MKYRPLSYFFYIWLMFQMLGVSAQITDFHSTGKNYPSASGIESFTPQGTVKNVRQVVASFTEPMVPMGDPRLQGPFIIECPIEGHGHWVDARHWVYDLNQDMPAGLVCQFTIRSALKSYKGTPLPVQTFKFSTGAPAIQMSLPREGSQIDEEQIFLLRLDTEANLKSVEEHAFCKIKGIGERIYLKLITGSQRQELLQRHQKPAYDLFQGLLKNKKITAKQGTLPKSEDPFASILAAQCARPLPPDAEVYLVWGKGVRSATGIAAEQDQTISFKSRPDFMAKIQCTRLNKKAGCIPILPIRVEFTAPLAREKALGITLRTAEGKKLTPKIEEHVNVVESVTFEGPFLPESTLVLDIPQSLTDDHARLLMNRSAFPMPISMAENPPLIKFPSEFGILEANAQPVLPVSVRNVESTLKGISVHTSASLASQVPQQAGRGTLAHLNTQDDQVFLSWLRRAMNRPVQENKEGETSLLAHTAKEFDKKAITLPLPEKGKAFELMGIPLPQPGFYIIEFSSLRLGRALLDEQKPYYAHSSALVTNLAVHFKKGRESSLVWVTRLDNAQPVHGAQVRVSNCDGQLLWEGKTNSQGIASIRQELPNNEQCNQEPRGLLVTARQGEDFSFALSSWTQGINRWEFNLSGGRTGEQPLAHTVFDRPLFRAGETVSMKHFIRFPTGKDHQGFHLPAHTPEKALIQHLGSDQRYEVGIDWKNNAGISTWIIPKEAKLGTYSVTLKSPEGDLDSGTFRVEQFRVPLMKALLKPLQNPIVASDKATIDAQLSYLSGGPASGAPVKFRSRVVEHYFSFPDYEEFHFGGKLPKEGIQAIDPYSYEPESEENQEEEEVTENHHSGYPVRTRPMVLDAQGGARVEFKGLPKTQEPQDLEVEMEYSDPNGQRLTASSSTLILPSNLILGISTNSQEANKDRVLFKVVALDSEGKVKAGQSITVEAYKKTTYSYRKRTLGGFYHYEQTEEVKRLKEICEGQSDQRGILICKAQIPATGEIILVARAKDEDGHVAIASDYLSIASEDHWYSASSNDRMDLIADKRSYEPGEKARFEVRMPFREATALVTVEREGILNSWIVPVSAKNPFVEVPVLKEYGPNVYISVMAVRGRIQPENPSTGYFNWLKRMAYRLGQFLGLVKALPKEVDTSPTALVDLTKPAFKLGIAQIRVGWKGYALNVKVSPERSAYKVRDRAKVHIQVMDMEGKPASHAEVALAAVDEGLLALSPPRSWELLEAMMERRALEVDTATAQSHVIGKRHFGKKSVAPGGGGGSANARELFDTLLLWKPSVALDAQGRASIEVPLNDALTSFRIEAIAHQGVEQFGSGGNSIRTTQDVMLLAGFPPFVREGDHFDAMATVRNGSQHTLTLDVSAYVAPTQADEGGNSSVLKPSTLGVQRLTIQAGEARTITFPFTVPFHVQKLDWLIKARDVNHSSQDVLKVSQRVGEAQPVKVYQQTLERLETSKPLNIPVSLPQGAITGKGGINVFLSASLSVSNQYLKAWMKRYPYSCLEQQISKAVALEDLTAWQNIMNHVNTYLDEEGLAKYFPMAALEGSDSLTSYILTIAAETGWEIPEASRMKMLKGLQDFVAGRIHRYGHLQTADVVLRKLAAVDALAHYHEANPRMLESLEIAPNLWPSSGVIDWLSILGKVKGIPEHDKKLSEALQTLHSRLMFSGTQLSFSTEKSDELWWLMLSPDVNAARTIKVLIHEPEFQQEMPRLMRGVLARQREGHWSTTTANAWGILALRAFKEKFERIPVQGITKGMLSDQQQAVDWSASHKKSEILVSPDTLGMHFVWPKIQDILQLQHQGSGTPWAVVSMQAAMPVQAPLFSGYKLIRRITPIEQHHLGQWSIGDVYRVSLDIESQTDMTWVVVNDSVPAGATILGSGLGGESIQLTAGEKKKGDTWPVFEERAFDSFKAYYDYVPKGRFTIEYTVRLNNSGKFKLPGARVEAMYAPEIFGERPGESIEVKGQ